MCGTGQSSHDASNVKESIDIRNEKRENYEKNI